MKMLRGTDFIDYGYLREENKEDDEQVSEHPEMRCCGHSVEGGHASHVKMHLKAKIFLQENAKC